MPEKKTDEAIERKLQERKRYLRHKMREKRRNADPDWVRQASDRIQSTLIRQPEFTDARAIGLYLALPHEVQTTQLIHAARDAGKRICAPAFNEAKGRYELNWLAEDDDLKRGRMDIREPASSERAGFMDLDLLVIPAVAYDPRGGRLGHGGGHYDRILGAWSGIKVGVAFQFQMYDEVPMGSHDIPVDHVITELRVYREERTKNLSKHETITK